MTETLCHSCGGTLPSYEEGSVVRCPGCGTAQVRLSEELQSQAAAQRARYEARLAEGSLPERAATEMNWREAMGLAAGASAVAVLLCAVLPPLSTVAWLLPAAVLLLYRMRFPQTVVTPLAGARVGAIVGLLCSAGAGVAGTVYLLVLRFGLHRMSGFDALYAGALAAAQKQAEAQNGAAAAASFTANGLGGPEFRAGMLLLFALLAAGVFVLLCVACGTVVAAIQRQREARDDR